jgi:chromosome segregation ATPase
MIQLKHIEALDSKVKSALALIAALRTENADLLSKFDTYQTRISELEELIHEFKTDQGEIEEGILRALKQLDTLEDAVTEEPQQADNVDMVQSVSEESQPQSPDQETGKSEQELASVPGDPAGDPAPEASELDIF